MVRALLHIGMPKTGSTSIQKFLGNQRDFLADSGITLGWSANRLNSRELALIAAGNSSTDIRNLLLEANIAASKMVIFSSEHLFRDLRDEQMISNLAIAFSEVFETVKVLVFSRPAKELAVSQYHHYLRYGGTASRRKYVDQFLGVHGDAQIENRLNWWRNQFGDDNFQEVSLEKIDGIRPDAVSLFLSTQLGFLHSGTFDFKARYSNQGFSIPAELALRQTNLALAAAGIEQSDRRIIVKRLLHKFYALRARMLCSLKASCHTGKKPKDGNARRSRAIDEPANLTEQDTF